MSPPNAPRRADHGSKWAWIVSVVAIGLIAVNLRPFLSGPSAVLPDIVADIGLTWVGAALVTVLPFVVMGLGAYFAPELQNRLGVGSAVFLGLLGIVLGSLMRGTTLNALGLIISSVVCGSGVAVLQAIMPAFIRSRFKENFSPIMGAYSALLLGGGAIGAQLVPMVSAQVGSWRLGLAMLSIPAIVAIFVALPVFDSKKMALSYSHQVKNLFIWPGHMWVLMLVFGLLNMGYGSLITWLASYYLSVNLTQIEAGGLIGLMSIMQAISAMILPIFIRRNKAGWLQLFVGIGCQLIGFIFLLYPILPFFVTASLLGLGLGGTFSTMFVIVLKNADNNHEAIRLSAFVQGGGFLLTAAAPLVAAWLIHLTNGFDSLWWFHILSLLLSSVLIGVLSSKISP